MYSAYKAWQRKAGNWLGGTNARKIQKQPHGCTLDSGAAPWPSIGSKRHGRWERSRVREGEEGGKMARHPTLEGGEMEHEAHFPKLSLE